MPWRTKRKFRTICKGLFTAWLIIFPTRLKFGDEKLARQRIEIIKISFREKTPEESSEIQTLLDLYSDGSDTPESDLSEGDSLEFPTD